MITSIIGAEGYMGKWLTNHLTSLGHEVFGFNEQKQFESSILAESDLVIVSVPVGSTSGVVKAAIKHMRRNATIMEIASLKSETYEAMMEASSKGLNALCVHPMFGPSATSLKGKTIAYIPITDSELEKRELESVFPGASIVEVELECHDRLMSIILSLPYLVNLAFAGVIKSEDLNLLKKLSGTSFALQYVLIQSVASENTSLVHALLSKNMFLDASVEKLIENISMIMKKRESNNQFRYLHKEIKESLSKDPVYEESPRIRQTMYDLIQPLLR